MKATLVYSFSLALLLAPGLAAEIVIKAPLLPDVPAQAKPGLHFTVTANGKSDARTARLVALYVPAGQPITPLVTAGAFAAKWEGEIHSPLRGSYTFIADVKGSFTLSINGAPLLAVSGDGGQQATDQPVPLNKGPNRLVAELISDGRADAMVQLRWASSEFPPEAVPAMVFTHDAGTKELRAGARIRDGRVLFAQLRCAACHDGTGLVPPKGEGMPELAQDAPVLGELGSKFNEAWLAAWINDPHSIRPQALMPRVFPRKPGEIDQRAADLAAYFISQGTRDDAAPAEEQALPGGALFANLGCIACHTPPDFQDKDEHDRVPLGHVKAKWQAKALADYLKNPGRNYPSTRMPHFRLGDEEAARLTAYLFSGAQQEFPTGPAGDTARGAQLLVTANCLQCHAGLPPATAPKLLETLASGWTKGCMAADASGRGNAPDFAFRPEEREALLAFAAHGLDALRQDSPVEFSERQIKTLRCQACHSRDSEQSVWSQLENEMAALTAAAPIEEGEGRPMAGTTVPALTWLGEKLQPAWMERFIAGRVLDKDKPRPWLLARMPGFYDSRAQGLAAGFSLEHGFSLAPEKAAVPIDSEAVKIGETLIGENGGFNCTTCHGVGERPATAVFEAPGVNLASSRERLRKRHYDRWLLHPLRIDPETKMPRFSDDQNKTPLTDFYEGDALKQFDAIWEYLGALKK